MPNTPGQIGAGVTAFAPLRELSEKDVEIVENTLSALGNFHEVEEEDLDAVTALSGSGPAYVFEFAAALREAGVNCGLDENLANTLAVDTLLGAAMLLAESEETPEALRNAVISREAPQPPHSKSSKKATYEGSSIRHSRPPKPDLSSWPVGKTGVNLLVTVAGITFGLLIRKSHTSPMNALIYTNEYPPCNYGGAGVHVEYLTRELAKLPDVDVDVRAFGDQKTEEYYPLKVKGYPIDAANFDAPTHLHPIFESSQRAISYNADGNDADVVHCHTWYTHLAGIMTKINYGIPLVITSHSLEPLRPWKREQLKGGYDFSSWVEKSALEMADAVVAVSKALRPTS